MKNFSVADRGESLADQVYRQLATGILEGRYSPGERVNIRSLAEAIGVSQTPVREAITRLLSEGVLCTVGRAIEVPQVDAKDLEELFRLRLMLEGELAERAAPHVKQEMMETASKIQEELDEAIAKRDFKRSLQLNVQFHFSLYRAARQPITLQLVEKLWLLIGPSMNMMYPALASMRSTRHTGVLDAMRTKNASELRKAIEADIHTAQASMQSLQSILEAQALATADHAVAVRRPVGRPRKIMGA